MYNVSFLWRGATALRAMCIEHDYFNAADNDEYTHFFEMVEQCPTDNKKGIEQIARYILKYSEGLTRDYTENEAMESILFNLYNDCMYIMVEEV